MEECKFNELGNSIDLNEEMPKKQSNWPKNTLFVIVNQKNV